MVTPTLVITISTHSKRVCFADTALLIHHRIPLLVFILITGLLLPAMAVLVPDSSRTLQWVFFSDKPEQHARITLPARTLARRSAVTFPLSAFGDQPVAQRYIESVTATGGTLRHTVKWLNAGSFILTTAQADAVRRLPGVRAVATVATWHKTRPATLFKRQERQPTVTTYGVAYPQLQILNVPLARRYFEQQAATAAGDGVLIGLFDSGFFLDHPCFKQLRDRNAVIAKNDFVDKDSSIGHWDSNNFSHGSWTLSLIAGYDPGLFQGVAPGARFILARTENDYSETHAEEDNWAAAMVWAESLGVNIVSSSLGYRNDFDTGGNYPFLSMDGKSTIISMVADSAVRRGVIVVSAMGNERGSLNDTSITAPADVAGVVSVGAVNPDLSIASFSSTGPTADGRIKPDLVAPGVNIRVPDFVSGAMIQSGYVGKVNGTSFATPLVAGICALIMQANPGAGADSIKHLLYNSCRVVPGQDTMNNIYGRGVPDALSAVLRPADVAVSVCSDSGFPIAGCTIADSSGAVLGVTDSFGLWVRSAPALPRTAMQFSITDPWQTRTAVSITSQQNHAPVILHTTRSIVVRTTHSDATPVEGADIFWTVRPSAPLSHTGVSAADGRYRFAYSSVWPDTILITARTDDGLWSDTVRSLVTVPACTIAVRLSSYPISRFQLYPNVIAGRAARDRGITIDFVDSKVDQRQMLVIAVRSMAGTLVREIRQLVNARMPVKIPFDCRNGAGVPLVPGTYLLYVKYNDRVQMKKFIIGN